MGLGYEDSGLARTRRCVWSSTTNLELSSRPNSLKVSAAVIDGLVCVYEKSIHKRCVSVVVRSVLSR